MAKLSTYEQRVSTPTLRGVEQPRMVAPSSTQAIPEAIHRLARGVDRFEEGVNAANEAQAKAWSADAIAKARLDWAANMRRRQEQANPGAPEFTPSVLADFDVYADEAVETAPTPAAKNFFRGRMKELRLELAEKAMGFEATARVSYIETAHDRAITTAETLMSEDPNQYRVALAEQLALIRDSELGPIKKTEMTMKAINRISGAAVWSQIDDSPTAFLSSIGLRPDKDGKVLGDLKGVTENMAFNALNFDDRKKYYEVALAQQAKVNREAEEAIGGRTVKSTDATLRRLYELIDTDPIAAEKFALNANRNGTLSQDDMKTGWTKAREQARQRGPKSEYERTRNYVIQSLEPGPLVSDPAARIRTAEAVDMFDRWMADGKFTDAEIAEKGREVVKRFQFVSMRDTILVLPQPKYGEIQRDPTTASQGIAASARLLADKKAKGEITQTEYEAEMVILNRWRKAVQGQQ